MLAKQASNSDIDEMFQRLRKRKDDRICEIQMDQAVRMVQKRPFVQAAVQKSTDCAESVVVDPDVIASLLLTAAMSVNAIVWNVTQSYLFLLGAMYCIYKMWKIAEFKINESDQTELDK